MSSVYVERRSPLSFKLLPPLAMNPLLLQFVHPALQRSRVNRFLLEAARALDEVRVNDLYELYPDFNIDIEREQRLMESRETVVFQFPLYWYSSPSLLKEWFDLVLQYGWGFGSEGKALVGKTVKLAITTGASEHSYTREGHNRYTIEELIRPMECTFELCGMNYKSPFVVHDAMHMQVDQMSAVVENYLSWLKEDQ